MSNATIPTPEMKTFLATYDWAKNWQDLPWAHDEPTLFLADICQQRRPGRALDIGCGAGTDSVFLAKRGWEVTALDFMPKALEYTQARAREAGVDVTPVEADVTQWQPPHAYDLVLDHGLLHNMDPERHAVYRERVMAALAEDGDFLLLHWHPRFPGQPNGRMGPRRVGRGEIQAFFAPELSERFFAREEFEDLPDLVGGSMVQAYYWFRRNPAYRAPAELLGQIRDTLGRHGVSPETVLAAAADPAFDPALPPGLLERIVGPGRLGLTYRAPEPAELEGVIAAWAATMDTGPRIVETMLGLFASEKYARICLAGAPRCTECGVVFCKRQRHR